MAPRITCSATAAFCSQLSVAGWSSHPAQGCPFSHPPPHSASLLLEQKHFPKLGKDWKSPGFPAGNLSGCWEWLKPAAWGWVAGGARGILAASQRCSRKGEAAGGRALAANATHPGSTAFWSSASFRQAQLQSIPRREGRGGARGAEAGRDDGGCRRYAGSAVPRCRFDRSSACCMLASFSGHFHSSHLPEELRRLLLRRYSYLKGENRVFEQEWGHQGLISPLPGKPIAWMGSSSSRKALNISALTYASSELLSEEPLAAYIKTLSQILAPVRSVIKVKLISAATEISLLDSGQEGG